VYTFIDFDKVQYLYRLLKYSAETETAVILHF